MHRDATDFDVDGAGLTAPQTLVLAALLAGDPVTTAAEKGGVRRETVHRWTTGDPAFIAALRRGKADILCGARTALRNLATEAVEALAGVLRDPQSPPAARIKAAATVLEMVGIDRPEPIGKTDPGDVEIEIADAVKDRRLARALNDPGDVENEIETAVKNRRLARALSGPFDDVRSGRLPGKASAR